MILVTVLLGLGLIVATGTYFALDFAQPKTEAVITAPNPSSMPSTKEAKAIEDVKAANEPALLEMEGVEKVEVGEKDGESCVIVFSFEETEELQDLENTGLDGYKVVVQNPSRSN